MADFCRPPRQGAADVAPLTVLLRERVEIAPDDPRYMQIAAGGATRMETLKAATIGSAEVIAHSADVGSLEPGKFADLLVLDADPLADIANAMKIGVVMKNGRLYDPATLDEIWPRSDNVPESRFAQDGKTLYVQRRKVGASP